MKKITLLFASALMVGVVACTKTPETTPDPSKEPANPSEEPVNPSEEPQTEKSKACNIISLTVVSGDVTIEGEIFEEEKFIELTYEPEQAAALADATATVVISDKATISPDPATIKDWTQKVELTVTAEDGETSKTYSVEPAPVQYTVSIAAVEGVDGKKLVEIGANNDIAFFAGNQIAFCSTENIVTADGRVYDLTLKFVGDLNRGEIPTGCAFTSLGNDDNGVLIAAVGYGADDYATPNVDEVGVNTWNYTNATRFYAWKDGWDKAPVKIYENASFLSWMNVSGDVNGKMLITAKQSANQGNHHLFHFDNCVVDGSAWAWYNTGKMEIDRDRTDIPDYAPADKMNWVPAVWRLGQTAGSTVSPLGVDKNSAIFVHGQALSALSEEAPGFDIELGIAEKEPTWGKDGNAGMIVAVRNGYQGSSMILRGTAEVINGGTKRYGGLYGWGNVCTTGNIKAFSYSGNVYAAISGSDWNEPHITVVDVTASTEDKTAYLLNTQGKARELVNPITSVAYVYNPATDEGQVVAFFENSGANENESFIRFFKVTRKKL